MKRSLSTCLFLLFLTCAVPAQNQGDVCHVYVVNVAKARKALARFRETGNAAADEKALSVGQAMFPVFRTTIGEEELTTKSYRFPSSKFIITASVFYTDESMASFKGADSMLLGIVVSAKAQRDALSSKDNAMAEVTLNSRDTIRVKKYIIVNGRLYLVGLECNCNEKSNSK